MLPLLCGCGLSDIVSLVLDLKERVQAAHFHDPELQKKQALKTDRRMGLDKLHKWKEEIHNPDMTKGLSAVCTWVCSR